MSIYWDRPCYKCRSHTCDMSCTEPAPQPAQDALQDIAMYIGVGGYNGATTEQLAERIRNEFDRLTALQSAQPIDTSPERVEKIGNGGHEPQPPHECKTEAEKVAYAAGWWKALEVNKVNAST